MPSLAINATQSQPNAQTMDETLAHKVVLITGSSSGIGDALALKFVSGGASVVITGRDDHKMASTVHKCRQLAPQCAVLAVEADLTRESDARALVDQTLARFGRLDILVTNEGAVRYHSATDPNLLALFDAAIAHNVRSVLQLVQICVPHLERTQGVVVNVSSAASQRPIPGMMTFCAAKAALDMTSKCLALELAPKHIRVNCVHPALTRTPLLGFADAPPTGARLRSFQEVEDIANAVLFLSSPKASFITGAGIPVDGTLLSFN